MSRDDVVGIAGIAILVLCIAGSGAWLVWRRDSAQTSVIERSVDARPKGAMTPIPAPTQAAAPGVGERLEGTIVVGVVRNEAGSPVSGARVSALYFDGRPRMGSEALTGADGRFALDGVVPGAYTLRVVSAEGSAVVDRLEVGAEGTRVLETPLVVHPGTDVEFQIRDPQGKALEGVSISVRQVMGSADRRGYALEVLQASTGGSGLASLKGLGDGAYEVRLAKEGFAILNDRFVVSLGRSEPASPMVRVLQASR